METARKKSIAPDGSKDENVFDIQQGVAIGHFVKQQSKKVHPSLPQFIMPIYGDHVSLSKIGQEQYLVGGKYRWLAEHDITTTACGQDLNRNHLFISLYHNTEM